MTRPPSPFQLQQAKAQLIAARRNLLETDPDLGRDERLLGDTLASDPETCEAFELLDDTLRCIVAAESMEDAANTRVIDLTLRRDRYKHRAQRLRSEVASAMEALGLTRRELPDLTASTSEVPLSVKIVDLTAIPDEYLRVKYEPMKAEIKVALQSGQSVAGAELSNAGARTLRIKSR